MRRWRNKMSQLTECDYDDGEVGACVVGVFLNKAKIAQERVTCVDHFANRFTGMDETIVRGAMSELLQGLEGLFAEIQLYDADGQLPYVFFDWNCDDLVITHLPY